MLGYSIHSNEFIFTGVILREGSRFSSLCIELDVASEGDTPEDASRNLLEAVTLYLETAIEANLPYLRPVPPEEDPRFKNPESVVKIFKLRVDMQIQAYA